MLDDFIFNTRKYHIVMHVLNCDARLLRTKLNSTGDPHTLVTHLSTRPLPRIDVSAGGDAMQVDSTPAAEGKNVICNTPGYLFFRLYHCLYERLLRARQLCALRGSEVRDDK